MGGIADKDCDVVDVIQAAVVTGRRVGADENFWSKLARDEQLFRKVVDFVANQGEVQASAPIEAPAVIIRPTGLGDDYWNLDDWQKFHGAKLTDEQRDLAPATPWDAELLASPCPYNPKMRIGETHYGLIGLPSIELEGVGGELLSVLKLQKLYPGDGQPRFASYAPGSWYSEDDFAKVMALEFKYYLVLREIVPRSEDQLFAKQEGMLFPGYGVPSAILEITKDLLIPKKTGVFVNSNRWARTADLDSTRYRLLVGRCGAGVVDVNFWSDVRDDYIGVGAFRKFKQKLAA